MISLSRLPKKDRRVVWSGLGYSYAGFQVNMEREISSYIFNYYGPTGERTVK